MFEKIVLRRSTTGVALTPGEIAEALLFYQNVHVVLDYGTIMSISKSLGMRAFLSLVRRKRLSAVYTSEMLMAHCNNVGSISHHGFVAGILSGKQGEQLRKGRRAHLELALEQSGHSREEAAKLAEQFMEVIPIKSYSSNYFVPGGILSSAAADLRDGVYISKALRCVLANQVGFEPFADNLQVDIVTLDDGSFVILSNIDFEAGNARRRKIDPALGDFGEGGLAVALLDANADVNIASLYGGDFYTSSMSSDIVRVRFSELLRRTGVSASQLQQFKDIVLTDYPTLKEVINSKERSFSEFEKLLEKSDKFRRSVHQMSPDANLVGEYFRETMREGWISSLPAKGVRFVVGLGIGAVDPIAGAAFSGADTFLLDKLKGWRPSHFVDGKLKPFLEDKN